MERIGKRMSKIERREFLRLSGGTVLLVAGSTLIGCSGGKNDAFSNLPPGSGGGPQPGSDLAVTRFVESIAAIDETQAPFGGDAVRGMVPQDGSGPAVALRNGNTVETVRGGSALISLEVPARAQSLLVGVEGIDGYYQINLGATRAVPSNVGGQTWLCDEKSNTSVLISPSYTGRKTRSESFTFDLIVTFPATITEPSVRLVVVAVYGTRAANNYSPPAQVDVTYNSNGQASQNLQMSISWVGTADVDLHVTPPGGAEIFFNNRSGQGGELDVDANPSCGGPHGTVENITWANQDPPVGVYTIRPDYFATCEESSTRYTITVRNSIKTQRYVGTFSQSEADGSGATDPSKIIYICVLPPKSTEAGLLSRLLLAEVNEPGSPPNPIYSLADATKGMQAVRAIVENRKRKPSAFNASGATTEAIITAPGQFAGFIGGVSSSIEARVLGRCTPAGNTENYVPYWNAMFAVINGPVQDPFSGVTQVGVEPGTWGVRTAGSASPGGNFVKIPNGTISGQDFYTIKKGLV